MGRPFVVFSLPRSRSTWLSVFLSSPEARCGHDIGPTLDRPEEFAGRLRGDLPGTCETGAAFAWPLICEELPEARFAVIRRPVPEVVASLAALGIWGDDLEAELYARDGDLTMISAQPGVLTLEYRDLSRVAACSALYRHCLNRDMPLSWWAGLDPINIQIDIRRQIDLLIARRSQIEALKTAVRERMAHA